MPMDAHDIEAMIKAAIPDAEVTIRDLAGDGDHYAATVISRILPRQVPRPAAPDRLSVAEGARWAACCTRWRCRPGCRARLTYRIDARRRGTMMAAENPRGAMFRVIVPNQHSRVTYAELFFDLVFVFAITQISRTLLPHFTPLGAVCDVTMLFLAVWWVWVYTAWITNWLNPEETPVRLLLFVLMLGGLVLSTSIPTAFEGAACGLRSPMRPCRSDAPPSGCAPTRAIGRRVRRMRSAFWLALDSGGLLDRVAVSRTERRRLGFWIVGAGDRVISPAVRFWVPSLGASSVEDWAVEGGHMAERCAVLHHHRARRIRRRHRRDLRRAGLDRGQHPAPSSRRWSAASRCGGSTSTRARKPAQSGSQRPPRSGRLARLAYTYLHMPIVAGIILSAVCGRTGAEAPDAAIPTSGPSSARSAGRWCFWSAPSCSSTRSAASSSSPTASASSCCWCCGGSPPILSPLWLSVATTVILIVVAVWGRCRWGRSRRRQRRRAPAARSGASERRSLRTGGAGGTRRLVLCGRPGRRGAQGHAAKRSHIRRRTPARAQRVHREHASPRRSRCRAAASRRRGPAR